MFNSESIYLLLWYLKTKIVQYKTKNKIWYVNIEQTIIAKENKIEYYTSSLLELVKIQLQTSFNKFETSKFKIWKYKYALNTL